MIRVPSLERVHKPTFSPSPVEKTDAFGTTNHSMLRGIAPETGALFGLPPPFHELRRRSHDLGVLRKRCRRRQDFACRYRDQQAKAEQWDSLDSSNCGFRPAAGPGRLRHERFSHAREHKSATRVGAGFRLEFASRSALIHLRHRAISREFRVRPLVLRPRITPGVLLSGGSCLREQHLFDSGIV